MNTNSPWISISSLARSAAVVLSVSLSGYVQADNNAVSVSETVSTAGIDLNTPKDARKLYYRLTLTARRLCADPRLGLQTPVLDCYEDALGNAVRSVNWTELTMVYLNSRSIQTAQAHGIKIPVQVANK